MSEPRTATYFGLLPRERLEAEALRLEHAVARVRGLHAGHWNRSNKCVCLNCMGGTGKHYPADCPTLRALDGQEETSE